MAWNRPSESPKASERQCSGKKNAVRAWTVAGGCLIVIGGIALWVVLAKSSTSKSDSRSPSRSTRIHEVAPAKVTTKSPSQEVVQTPQTNVPQRVGEIRDGKIKLPSGRLYQIKGVVTNRTGSIKGKYAIFENRCDNEIAGLISVAPGTLVVGPASFKGRFTKEFLKSISTPIIVTSEDTPETAELKRAVNQAKIELKDAYDRGEDIEKIMEDSRNELQKLSRYKTDLEHELAKIGRESDMTAEQLESAFEAANKMLESKGIAPTLQGPITRQKMRQIYREQRQAKEIHE